MPKQPLEMSQPPKTLSGACACGDISYTSTEPAKHTDYCYCLTCQRMAGAPFMAWTGVPKTSLTWTFKSPPVMWRAAVGDTDIHISERAICGTCGTNLSLQYFLYTEKTHIPATSIRHTDFAMPAVGCHIWCKHVPAWHTMLGDGVPRYEEFDEDFHGRMQDYLKQRQKTA